MINNIYVFQHPLLIDYIEINIPNVFIVASHSDLENILDSNQADYVFWHYGRRPPHSLVKKINKIPNERWKSGKGFWLDVESILDNLKNKKITFYKAREELDKLFFSKSKFIWIKFLSSYLLDFFSSIHVSLQAFFNISWAEVERCWVNLNGEKIEWNEKLGFYVIKSTLQKIKGNYDTFLLVPEAENDFYAQVFEKLIENSLDISTEDDCDLANFESQSFDRLAIEIDKLSGLGRVYKSWEKVKENVIYLCAFLANTEDCSSKNQSSVIGYTEQLAYELRRRKEQSHQFIESYLGKGTEFDFNDLFDKENPNLLARHSKKETYQLKKYRILVLQLYCLFNYRVMNIIRLIEGFADILRVTMNKMARIS